MMWVIRGQSNQKPEEIPSDELDWTEVQVATKAEAEVWWECRTQGPKLGRCVVHTMWNPSGKLVRVLFR